MNRKTSVKVGTRLEELGGNQFFLIGVLVGSAAGLLLGSALGFELRPDRIKAFRKYVRRLSGQNDHPHYDLMV